MGICKRLCRSVLENVKLRKPDDFVIATGKSYTIKHFLDLSLKKFDFKYNDWKGFGYEMYRPSIRKNNYKDNKNTRPTEVHYLHVTIKKLKLN